MKTMNVSMLIETLQNLMKNVGDLTVTLPVEIDDKGIQGTPIMAAIAGVPHNGAILLLDQASLVLVQKYIEKHGIKQIVEKLGDEE